MRELVSRIPTSHRLLIISLSVVLLLVLFLPSESATASKSSQADTLEIGKRYSLELTLPDVHEIEWPEQSQGSIDMDDRLNWQSIEVSRGDALSNLFRRANVSQQTMLQVLAVGDATKTLTRLFPSETLEFGLDEAGELQELRYAISRLDTLRVYRHPEGHFQAEQLRQQMEVRTDYASATINSSFWNAGVSAGLTEAQIMDLATIFGWDIDFGLDIRAGDSFTVLFEQNYVDGELIGNGAILAAQFSNQGRLIQTVRHTDGHYYKADGTSMRQAFLRAPVNFMRISSNFNPRRLHPITGRVAPHNGIDYVAPVGTPILSTGDGRVIASTYNNLNGNYVFIQHGQNIVTKYLHLSRRQVKVGDRVRQGQVIGRLGATGRVTGAHLHYEFVVNGVHRNPRTVQLPKADSLEGSDREQFLQHASSLLTQLQAKERVLLAAN
ncbi:MAG: peptidoglycan DD-metalloendopeptidase family protein [Alkalimonas sp.]|nr:peptidoglycan DD-metalloendopeptidase family protein [Alkalimonas sp.]